MRWCGIAFVLLLTLATPKLVVAETADETKLKESLATWEKVKKECEGNYAIVVRWSSAFGFGNETTITVKGNKVVERKYVVFGGGNGKPMPPETKWTETGAQIGTHKGEGAIARTVDDIYAEAKKLLSQEAPKDQKRFVGYDKQGLLTHCFTKDLRIADDAPQNGIPYFQIQLPAKK